MARQYGDLPLIPQSMDEYNNAGWGTEHLNHVPLYRYQHGDVSPEGEVYPGDFYDNGMVMDRFMQDPYPLAHGFLHAQVPVQQSLDQQYNMQWPAADCYRHVSPSPSGNSSGPTQSEHCSPHVYYAVPYGSPKDLVSHSALPYPTVEHFHDDGYMSQAPQLGGCSLRELEYTHPEPERMVDDSDNVEMKEEIPCDHNHVIVAKIDTDSDSPLGYADSGIGNSVRDAESVQPDPAEQEEDATSDSDYSPASSRSGKRRRSSASNGSPSKVVKRRGSARKDSNASSTTGTGKPSRKSRGASSNTKSHTDSKGDRRHFPCPFTVYGCNSNFASKNEWKRHVSTQHIKLTFWRCDLCAPTTDPNDDRNVYYNDFNRKDLFTQHLRRMHSAPQDKHSRNQKVVVVTDDNILEHQTRCLQQLRKAPRQSVCLFCDKTFDGRNSWEEHMEHVGKHLEKDRSSIVDMLDITTWNDDEQLERYLQEEGLIVRDGGQWKLGDGKPIRHGNATIDPEEDQLTTHLV